MARGVVSGRGERGLDSAGGGSVFIEADASPHWSHGAHWQQSVERPRGSVWMV